MFTETLTGHDGVIGIACEGKLTVDDLKRMHALLHERFVVGKKPGLVVDLTGFDGYEGFSALREDLKLVVAHRNDFDRIAVIGDQEWIAWGTSLARAVTSGEMRWFVPRDRDAGAEWARRG